MAFLCEEEKHSWLDFFACDTLTGSKPDAPEDGDHGDAQSPPKDRKSRAKRSGHVKDLL